MDPIEAVQPDHEHPAQPTIVHHFLAAKPGTWQPINITSNAPVPQTLDAVNNLTQFAGQATGMDPALLVWFGSSVLVDEPYMEQGEQEAAPVRAIGRPRLITPPQGLIVPGQ